MKKVFCALIAIVLLMSTAFCTVSCSEDNGDENESKGNVSTLAPDAEYKAPDVTFDGKNVTIATYDYDAPWVFCSHSLTDKEDDGSVIGKSIVQRNLAVENELDVNIELFALSGDDRGNSTTLQNSIQKGESLFDFALPMSASIAPMLATKGMLTDLKSIETLDLTHSWWNQDANFEYTLYGKQYAAVGDICYFNLGSPIATYFNKDMISKYKLEDPYVLAENGEWTLEKAIEMSRAVSSDNGDGVLDDNDTFGFGAEKSSLIYLLFSSGVRLTGRDSDGNIVPTLYSARSDTIASTILTLIADNATARSMGINVLNSSGSFHSDYAMPKMGKDELLFISFQLLGGLNMSALGINFGVVPSPKYDIFQEDYISFGNTWFSDHLIVPAISPDIEMVGYVVESMGYYAQQYITPAVVEQSVTLRGVTDETSAYWMNQVIDSQIFDIGYIFNWAGVVETVCNNVATGERTFTNNWYAIETKFKTELNQTVANLTS